jgi:hypothetical protein
VNPLPGPQLPRREGNRALYFGAVLLALLVVGGGGYLGKTEPAAVVPSEHPYEPGWAWVNPALAGMSAVAIQLCTTDVALAAAAGPQQLLLQGRLDELTDEYARQAEDYDARLAEHVANGERRPWDIPAAAPPVSVTKGRACAKLAPPEARPKPLEVAPGQRVLSLDQLDAAAAAAGWPMTEGWWPQMRLIVICESGGNMFAHNTSDPNGGSYGLAQLNGTQHFDRSGEDFAQRFDPVVNLRTALWLRTVRGHFGGGGGWKNCSEKYGIN